LHPFHPKTCAGTLNLPPVFQSLPNLLQQCLLSLHPIILK
jgi:hypothetical protein